jgi:hypothetical protein
MVLKVLVCSVHSPIVRVYDMKLNEYLDEIKSGRAYGPIKAGTVFVPSHVAVFYYACVLTERLSYMFILLLLCFSDYLHFSIAGLAASACG